MHDLPPELGVLRQIAESSSHGVFIYDVALQEMIFNNTIAAAWIEKYDTPYNFVDIILASLDEDLTNTTDLRGIHPHGQVIARDVEFCLAKDEDKKYFSCNRHFVNDGKYAVIFLRDISISRQHEDYLIEFGTRKNTVLDTLTHHMSGALTLMQNLSKEARKYASSNDKNLTAYLGLLQENSNQCILIINDLLKNEHQQSPQISVKNSRINLVEKVWIVYDEFQQSYPGRKFEFKSTTEFIEVNTDEIKLLQVVNNLVSNAIKFSESHLPIKITITDFPHEVVVSIIDCGIGIPDPLRPLIFERQLGTGRVGLQGETSIGLGLSICRNLIILLKGRIWFESTEGKGSTFSFALPKRSSSGMPA